MAGALGRIKLGRIKKGADREQIWLTQAAGRRFPQGSTLGHRHINRTQIRTDAGVFNTDLDELLAARPNVAYMR
jgi:hypothetical protein